MIRSTEGIASRNLAAAVADTPNVVKPDSIGQRLWNAIKAVFDRLTSCFPTRAIVPDFKHDENELAQSYPVARTSLSENRPAVQDATSFVEARKHSNAANDAHRGMPVLNDVAVGVKQEAAQAPTIPTQPTRPTLPTLPTRPTTPSVRLLPPLPSTQTPVAFKSDARISKRISDQGLMRDLLDAAIRTTKGGRQLDLEQAFDHIKSRFVDANRASGKADALFARLDRVAEQAFSPNAFPFDGPLTITTDAERHKLSMTTTSQTMFDRQLISDMSDHLQTLLTTEGGQPATAATAVRIGNQLCKMLDQDANGTISHGDTRMTLGFIRESDTSVSVSNSQQIIDGKAIDSTTYMYSLRIPIDTLAHAENTGNGNTLTDHFTVSVSATVYPPGVQGKSVVDDVSISGMASAHHAFHFDTAGSLLNPI